MVKHRIKHPLLLIALALVVGIGIFGIISDVSNVADVHAVDAPCCCHQLTVNRTGNSTGTVDINPGNLHCGPTCSSILTHGTLVTLTATHDAGTSVTWSGCTPVHNDPRRCTVLIDQTRTVTARFDLIQPVLTVTVIGQGSVTSSPAGISCRPTCSHAFDYNTPVTLTARPAFGTEYVFDGWGGACAGDNYTCQVTMNQPRSVTARFASLISSISTPPPWVRQRSPFNITVTTARPSTCNLTVTSGTPRVSGVPRVDGDVTHFEGIEQDSPVIYNIECTYTHADGTIIDREPLRINVLPRFGEF